MNAPEQAPQSTTVLVDDALLVELASRVADLAYALVEVEWAAGYVGHAPGGAECPSCSVVERWKTHGAGCSLDAALTRAGLDTQEKREAARAQVRATFRERTRAASAPAPAQDGDDGWRPLEAR